MEKKGHTPVISLAVAVVSVLGLVACGIACFTLTQTLRIQRQELNETRTQVSTLDQALEVQRRDLSETREQLATATNRIAGAEQRSESLNQQLTALRSKSHESRPATEGPPATVQVPAAAPDIPAGDSVEGKLQAEGKSWERAQGQPAPGGYVLDIMDGRLNQPKGRGRIGMVVSVAADESDRPVATVDFGRGFIVGISGGELAPVRILAPEVR
jgi:outer membrane murein-binding lipoprotein Lpp